MQYEMEQVSIRMVKEPPLISDRPITGPDSAVDIIGEYLGVPERDIIRKVIPLAKQSALDEISYLLGEYRQEILASLCYNESVIRRAVVKLKRELPDKGYALSKSLDSSDFRLALALAPDFCGGEGKTLAFVMKSVGVLDAFL